MRFGICCGPGSFVQEAKGQAAEAVPRMMETLQEAGADYVEFTVGSLNPEGPEEEFETLREALRPFSLRVEAFNSFIPGTYPITGPHADGPAALEYCRKALRRCKALGGEVVVLGSAGARRIPTGFSHAEGERQFVAFCRMLGPVAESIGIEIAIEPLNSKEDNLVISVEHGARLVDEIGHPNIRLLADLYHISQEKEPLEHVAQAGARLVHTHCADLERVPPGFAPEGEEDFLGFFRNLRRAGYDRRCSFEGIFDHPQLQAKPLIGLLRRRWKEAG
ncbi:MAG: sugar phosphate isomerase/epimerase [Armatimonadota bacterium]|nr:sugar phosphate isomerase/epimerase [Armatimonadota bacterium]